MSDEEQQIVEVEMLDGEIFFGEVFEQFEGILCGIESDEIDVDCFGEELWCVMELFEVCWGKICCVEVEVCQIVDQFD